MKIFMIMSISYSCMIFAYAVFITVHVVSFMNHGYIPLVDRTVRPGNKRERVANHIPSGRTHVLRVRVVKSKNTLSWAKHGKVGEGCEDPLP